MTIYRTTIFKLSIVSSLLLLLFVSYSDKLWSEFWVLSIFFDLVIFLFFAIVFIKTIFFWGNKNTQKAYLPFFIALGVLTLVIATPLNFIRERAGLFIWKNDYERAVKLVYTDTRDSTYTFYKLPNEYQSLSVADSRAISVNTAAGNAVFFFTFAGIPDGVKGFLKLSNGSSTDIFTKRIGYRIENIKDLGDNWYYVYGN